MQRIAFVVFLQAVCILTLHLPQVSSITCNVVPGADSSADKIALGDGTHTDMLDTRRPGEEGKLIYITGGAGAVMKGESTSVRVRHLWITLEGRTAVAHPKIVVFGYGAPGSER